MSVLQNRASNSFLAIVFSYGDPSAPTFLRLTNWGSNVTVGGNVYTSFMALDVSLPQDRGAMFEGAATVSVPVGADSLFSALTSGEPHSPVYLTIYEVRRSLDAVSEDVLTLFTGKVSHAIKNFRGSRDLVGLRVQSLRTRLDVPLGIQCNVQCVWTFTGNGCEIDPTGLAQTVTLYSVDRLTATILDATQPPFFSGADVSRYWRRGYVEKDGLRILIVDWSSSVPHNFDLARKPPASWVGTSVSLFPGCDKVLATCQNQWDNEEHFGGFGFAMPAYKPTFENPGSV